MFKKGKLYRAKENIVGFLINYIPSTKEIEDSVPSLFFKTARPVSEGEILMCVEIINNEEEDYTQHIFLNRSGEVIEVNSYNVYKSLEQVTK